MAGTQSKFGGDPKRHADGAAEEGIPEQFSP